MKKKELNRVRDYLHLGDKITLNVSEASAYWHIDHLLQVIMQISRFLISSDPKNFTSTFNLTWYFIKFTRKIPRGAGKSPKSVTPLRETEKAKLLNQFEVAISLISEIGELNKRAYFDHPYFGQLNLKNAQYFLSIHTNHHLKIIHEIHQ